MNRLINWLFGSRTGWIILCLSFLAGMMYFQPQLLAKVVNDILASLINLIGMILVGTLNGAIKILQANQQSLEYLFCIIFLCFGIVLMFRAVFRRGGTKK